MSEVLESQHFGEIIEPIAAELEVTANAILAEQRDAHLGGVLGIELETDPDTIPLANTTLSCTNPSCGCSCTNGCSDGGDKR